MAKGKNFAFFTTFSINLTERSPTIKALKKEIMAGATPTSKRGVPALEASKISNSIEPRMTGMLSINENSALSSLFAPLRTAAQIVVPLRESPGKTAMPCARPTQTEFLKPNGEPRFLAKYSVKISRSAVSMKHTGSSSPPNELSKNSLKANTTTSVRSVER